MSLTKTAIQGRMSGAEIKFSIHMRFTILVTTGPYQHQASDSAYHFAEAALALGHQISAVFFYHDGVYNATRLGSPPQDDRNISDLWSQLAKEHRVDLVFCSTAGLRRGILDSKGAQASYKDTDNADPSFRAGGLGQFVEMAIETDRTITFGD